MAILSRFLFGEAYELEANFAHGMHNVLYDRLPSADSEFLTAPSGEVMANVRRWDHTCSMTGRWIKAAPGTGAETPVSGGLSVSEFLSWARDMLPFRFVPDVTFPDLWVPDCYLVEPMAGLGSIDVRLERDVRFTIRTGSGIDFGPQFRGLFYHLGPSMVGATATRNSTAYSLGGAPIRYRQSQVDELLTSHRAYGEVGALIEGLNQINLVLKSCDVDAALTEWTQTGVFTLAVAQPLILGGTEVQPHRTTNPNDATGRHFRQDVGTLTGNEECVMLIVENIDALITRLGMRDSTASTWIHQVELTWATGVITTVNGSGEVLANEVIAAVGPNGGEVRRIVITGTGTATNISQIRIHPSGNTQNALTVVLHHAQWVSAEVCHSVIVTDTASVTRGLDNVSVPWPWKPQPMWMYLKFVDIGAGQLTNARLFAIEPNPNQAPRLMLLANTERRFRVFWEPETGTNRSSIQGTTGAHGDTVELLGLLNSDGSVQLIWALNGGSPTTESASSATYLGDHFGSERGYFGSRGGVTEPAHVLVIDSKSGPGVGVNTLALARAA